jgi:trehalose 6-phosphate synthase
MANLLPVSSRFVVALTVAVTVVLLVTAAIDIQQQVADAQERFTAQLPLDQATARTAEYRAELWASALLRMAVRVVAIVVMTLLILRWTLSGSIMRSAQWLRDLRLGNAGPVLPAASGLFKPLVSEVTQLVRSLETARAAAAEEAKLRDAAESHWTAERLRVYVRSKLLARPLFVVSNREPYMHVRRNGDMKILVPASGLVTALEPVLRACDGTWVAHGSGNADKESVDSADRVRVPPDHPAYTLRRVWLTREEEEGYYYGFSNEGLWPLCHIAHTRPLFRATDWASYERANRKFAAAVLDEMRGTESPIVLVQDYHFALVPRLIKTARPDAQVAMFWHIPWPNPEAFGICPWQKDLLDGLLGADLIGFHTQAHCNNFLDTVNGAFESQIEWERFTVRRLGHLTAVRPYPISVAVRETPGERRPVPSPMDLLKPAGVKAYRIGIGVDRADYTKGLLERFAGIERFFERWPEFLGEFTFIQIAAPSRTDIKRYQDLVVAIEAEAERVNRRFQTPVWKPIVLHLRHHGHEEIEPYYRAASLCLVTSLHDGMNLVAKEFVAARDDEAGVLILSQFAGASGELEDALIINPYDTEQLAGALHTALTMSDDESRLRMRRMRELVREHNVYRWAGRLIGDLSAIRIESADRPAARPARSLEVTGA